MLLQQRLAILLLLATVQLPLFAQRSDGLKKEEEKQIDQLFSSIGKHDPGCAVAIYRNGKIIYSKGFGSADLEHDVPITPSSRFDLGSTSKQFTAASLLLLQQDGLLSLDDDIRKWLPEIPDYGTVITIRNLLNHTSGLRDYIGLLILGGNDIDDVTTDKDALRMIARQKGLEFETGTEHVYSNTGYFLASQIVERASGMSLREFAQKRIFEPLGMKHSGYIRDHTVIIPERAIGYSPAEDGEGYVRDMSNWEQTGDGGLSSNVEDLLRWDENFYTGKVGGTELGARLMERGRLRDGEEIDYALGLFHDTLAGREMISHGGAWSGYRAELMRIPSEHLSVAILSNVSTYNPTAVATQVLKILLGEKSEAKPVINDVSNSFPVLISINNDLFDRYVGDYALDLNPDFVISIFREGEHYYTQATGQGALEIFPSSDTTFFLKEVRASLTFHPDASGGVNEITLHQGRDAKAHRVMKPTLLSTEKERYAGTYHSDELDQDYQVILKGDTLYSIFGRNEAGELEYLGENEFSIAEPFGHHIEFEQEGEEKASAFLMSLGRITGVRFERVEK